MIAQNKIVSIEYEVFNQADNTLLDSNKNGAPLEFLVGSGQVISGLENALMGASIGDNVKATIAPEDAYGTYQSDFVQEVAREQFEGIELKAGMTLFGHARPPARQSPLSALAFAETRRARIEQETAPFYRPSY